MDGGNSTSDISSYILPTEIGVAVSSNSLPLWLGVGAYIWIIGVAIMLIYGIATYSIVKIKMREAVHIRKNMYEAKNIKSPFVLGFFVPKIYLPFGLTGEKYNCVVLHEKIHIGRHDHIVKFMAYFILCVHWFNPLVCLAFKLMSKDMEMSCDEAVLKKMGIEETKTEYSMSLVALATDDGFVHGSPLAFGEGNVKERVINVLNFKKCPKVISVIAVILTVLLSGGLALSPIQASESVIQSEIDITAWHGDAMTDVAVTYEMAKQIAIDFADIAQPDVANLRGIIDRDLDSPVWHFVVAGGGVMIDVYINSATGEIANSQQFIGSWPSENLPISFDEAARIAINHASISPPFVAYFHGYTTLPNGSQFWRVHINSHTGNYDIHIQAFTGEVLHSNFIPTRRNVANNLSWWDRLWNMIEAEIEAQDANAYINPLNIAVSYTGTQGQLLDTIERLVYRNGRPVWFVRIFAHDTGVRYEVDIDARTGEVLRLESSEQ